MRIITPCCPARCTVPRWFYFIVFEQINDDDDDDDDDADVTDGLNVPIGILCLLIIQSFNQPTINQPTNQSRVCLTCERITERKKTKTENH